MEQINKKVNYYPCDNFKNNAKPLVVIMGYVKCSERILKKYKEIWDKYEFNSILCYPTLDVSLALKRYDVIEVLKCIHNHFELLKSSNIKDDEKSNQIFIHGISAGAICTPMLLRYMDTLDNGKYKYLLPFIKGIIMDSGMPIESNMFNTAYLCALKEEPIIKENLNSPLVKFMFEYNLKFKPLWDEYVANDLHYFFNSKYKYLIVHSDNDHFYKGIPQIIIDRIKSKNLENGINNSNNIIEMKVNSAHCEHYKYNPELYRECVKKLLKLSIKL